MLLYIIATWYHVCRRITTWHLNGVSGTSMRCFRVCPSSEVQPGFILIVHNKNVHQSEQTVFRTKQDILCITICMEKLFYISFIFLIHVLSFLLFQHLYSAKCWNLLPQLGRNIYNRICYVAIMDGQKN